MSSENPMPNMDGTFLVVPLVEVHLIHVGIYLFGRLRSLDECFERWLDRPSLELFFGEQQGFSAFRNEGQNTFEAFAKSLINLLTLEFLKIDRPYLGSVQERTDIQRKTPIVVAPFQTTTKMDIALPAQASQKKSSFLVYVSAALILIFAAGASARYFQRNNSSAISKPTRIVSAAPVEPQPIKIQPVESTPKPMPTQSVSDRPSAADSALMSPDEPLLPEETMARLEKELQNEQSPTPRKRARAAEKKVTADSGKSAQIESRFRQGMLHLKLQHSAQAIQEFQQILALDSKNSAAYRGLGLAYVYDEKFDKAIDAFETYLKLAKNELDRGFVERLLKTLKEKGKSAVASQ